MRSAIFVVVALLSVFAFGATLPEFIPCSFHVLFHTRVLNQNRDVIATSTDHVYYDQHTDDNMDLWRWDSDFSGVPGLMDDQHFIIIWRPDLDPPVSYHDYGDVCKINDGQAEMVPRPYDWFLRSTKGVTWVKLPPALWEGMPVDIYHSKFHVNHFNGTVTADIYILQEDNTLVAINGTADTELVHLTYDMDAIEYEHLVPINPQLFHPDAARCGQVTDPVPVTSNFEKKCYVNEEAGSYTGAYWLTVLALLFAVLLA